MNSLTTREVETALAIEEGLSNKLIADRLGISAHTAKFHVCNVMRKLGAQNRAHAAVLSYKRRAEITAIPEIVEPEGQYEGPEGIEADSNAVLGL